MFARRCFVFSVWLALRAVCWLVSNAVLVSLSCDWYHRLSSLFGTQPHMLNMSVCGSHAELILPACMWSCGARARQHESNSCCQYSFKTSRCTYTTLQTVTGEHVELVSFIMSDSSKISLGVERVGAVAMRLSSAARAPSTFQR